MFKLSHHTGVADVALAGAPGALKKRARGLWRQAHRQSAPPVRELGTKKAVKARLWPLLEPFLLEHLGLSTNVLGDFGVKHIAKALRRSSLYEP